VIYRPLAQNPWLEQEQWVVVKSAIEPQRLVNSIQAAMSRADARIPLYAVRTFQQVRRDGLVSRRFTMTTMTVYGAAAFGLAALGLYGVMAYVVQLRRREYGIQLALGASPARIRRQVVASGLGLATGGIVVGVVVAFAVSRLIWASVPGFDPVGIETFGLVSGLIALMALMASWGPAHRATRVDPAVALRCE
jgi:ABC-type antimicrobial peptide transport system permease subunit